MRLEKIREVFYYGLDESVKFELTKLPIKDHETILKTLLDMEHFLINKIYREQPNKTFESSYKDVKSRFIKNQNNKNEPIKGYNSKPKNIAQFIIQTRITLTNVEQIRRTKV